MRTRIVKRYHCDHCKKATLQRPAMERHEAGCTANPNRVCKMCRMNPHTIQKPMAEIVALINSTDWEELKEPEIREFVGNCPACLLAGSRQSKVGLLFHFDWKEESKGWLSDWSNTDRPGFSLP